MTENKQNEEFDLRALFVFVWTKKLSVVFFTLLLCFLTNGIFVFIDPIYKSAATLLPKATTSTNPLSKLFGNLIGGNSSEFDISRISNIFSSRRLAELVYNQNKSGLNENYFPEIWDEKQEKWLVSADKSPMWYSVCDLMIKDLSVEDEEAKIIVEYSSKAPGLSQKIVQDYVYQSRVLINEFRIDEAKAYSENLNKGLEVMKNEKLTENEELQQQFYNNSSQTVPSRVLIEFLAEQKLTKSQVFAAMEQNYQVARTSIFNDDMTFTVLDNPVVPLKPYFPNYKITVPLALVLYAFLLTMFYSVQFLVLNTND